MKKISDDRLKEIISWHTKYSPPWIYEGWKPGEQKALLNEVRQLRKTIKAGEK